MNPFYYITTWELVINVNMLLVGAYEVNSNRGTYLSIIIYPRFDRILFFK